MSSELQQAKERALQDLRRVREELLQRIKNSAQKETNKSPKVEPLLKLKSSESKEKSKKKKEKKHKHSHKKHKKSDKHKYKPKGKRHCSSSSSSSSGDEETTSAPPKKRSCSPEQQEQPAPPTRDDWMTSAILLKTFSKNKPLPKKQCTVTYEPGKSSRELNPHWKDGGSGLPSYKKPNEYDDYHDDNTEYSSRSYKSKSGGWRKNSEPKAPATTDDDEKDVGASSSSISKKESTAEFLTDQEMNELGAKIMKAELLNNTALAEELKNKLKAARQMREQNIGNTKDTNKFKNKNHRKPQSDASGGRRARSSVTDDEDNLKNKFEREKSNPRDPTEVEEDYKNFNKDFDDIFGVSKHEDMDTGKLQEIRDKNRPSKKLNNCGKCFNGDKINKELVVSVGKHVYLALPWHEGLQTNHCLIIPIDHYSSSTHLDEDVWQEISSYRRVLTKIFAKRKQDVLFFETARYLQKRPHMVINCVPADDFEMAPFYFKKAIEESEYEWSKNKQLVTLKEKNLRKSIPCGLPYFWVNFGMDFGFAHVIENQENFPLHFAQEIIGGMLTLDMRKWRSPREEHNVKTKVRNLADLLKPYEKELC